MSTDDPSNPRLGDQSKLSFDDAPERFREGNLLHRFSGASGALFEQAMAQTRMAIILCDPHAPDFPIVFANRAFQVLTGYREDEIIGRNCRFLQGPDTDQEPVARIREAIDNENLVVVEMRNYRKDGSSFWNALHLGPIYNDKGDLIYFFGSQWDVSDVPAPRTEERYAKEMARELSHRMKNIFAVISGIVNVTGRARGIQSETTEINARIQALGRAYETTLDDASSGSIRIGPSIRSVLAPYREDDGRLELDGDGARMPFGLVSIVGLILHELASNAAKYGAWSGEDRHGAVKVKWEVTEEGRSFTLSWVETGAPELDRDAIKPGTGSAIVDRLLRSAGGTIEREWNDTSFRAVVTIPL